jgi:cell division protein FtsQ
VFDRGTWTKLGIVSAAVVAALLGTYWGISTVARSKALTITTITVEGTVRMPEGIVREQLSDLVGLPMFSVNLDEWCDKVRELSWVAEASIRRVMPGTVAVTIEERRPMAIGRVGDTLNIIDRRGIIIDAFGPHYADLDLPIIDGLAYSDEREVGPLEQARALLAARLLTDLQRTTGLATRISQVDVSDEHDAVVVLKGDTTLVRLGESHFVDRLQSYLDLAPTLQERIPNAATVDLRYGSRIFVRPATGTSAAQTKDIGGEE